LTRHLSANKTLSNSRPAPAELRDNGLSIRIAPKAHQTSFVLYPVILRPNQEAF